MLSSNFFYRLRYQYIHGAVYAIFKMYIVDRLMHPFFSKNKKKLKKKHRDLLKTKKTTTDYFSINAFYWNKILNNNFKNFSYLEIGSWEGNSALYILDNHSTSNVVCIDLWDKADDFKDLNKKNFENFLENLKNFKERYSFHKMKSDDFFKNNNTFFDVIYIDGWHGTTQVTNDILNSWNCLNEGGILICDDYFYGDIYKNLNQDVPAPAINKFIRENQKKLKIICVNNTQIFLRKIN